MCSGVRQQCTGFKDAVRTLQYRASVQAGLRASVCPGTEGRSEEDMSKFCGKWQVVHSRKLCPKPFLGSKSRVIELYGLWGGKLGKGF